MEGNVELYSIVIIDVVVIFDGLWKLWGFNYYVMFKFVGVNSIIIGMYLSIFIIYNIKLEKVF